MNRLGATFSDHRVTTRRGSLLPGLLMLATYAVLAVLGAPLSKSTFVAKIGNSADTAASTGYFTCTGAATGGNAYFAYPLTDDPTRKRTAADASVNNRPGKYSASGITYVDAIGPCRRDPGKVATLDGKKGDVQGAQANNPQAFSVEIWFKPTVGGGKLIGFGNKATGASSSYDRHLYLTNTGTLTFGVSPGSVKETITSKAAYLDGNWHDAVATLAPASDPNPGIRLYVDGTLVAVDSTVVNAQVYSGYWRLGYDNLTGWTNAPTNSYFTGSLAYASVYTSALTPEAVAAHYRAGI